MRKQIFLSSVLLLGAALTMSAAERGGRTVALAGVEYSVDTLFHAKVGPGTTETSLHLVNETGQQLRVFYLTTDLTNPNTSIEAIVAQDKVPGGATVSSMAKDHTVEGKNYFCGVNTDFFLTSGSASNGKSIVGAPVKASVAGGEIYRSGSASTSWPNIFVDRDGKMNIGAVSFAKGTVTVGEKTATLKAINNDAPDNGISIYTPKYYGTPNQPGLNGQCVTVPVTLEEGDYVGAGKTLKFKVCGATGTNGDCAINDGEYVLLARGSAQDVLSGLKVGDEVSAYVKVTIGDTEVFPTQLACGNPWILKAGEVLDSEGDRGDASARHPRTGIGYSTDNTKLVMMVIDGRSAISAGVHTQELAGMLYYAGADEAVNVDGGGSSTMYTAPLGVLNKTSDGHERAVASGLFVVANVPDDKTVAEVRFVDWAMNFPKYGIYTPKFYGYNKYGVLVDTDLQGVKLSCDKALGEIVNDGATFYGTGEGMGALKATYNGIEAVLPVNVSASDDVAFRLKNIVIDNKREYPMEVQAVVNEKTMPINPVALTWTSENDGIATIGATDGVLRGVADGTTTITGKVGSFVGTANVSVEIPTGEVMPIAEYKDGEWKNSQFGGTDLVVSALENGVKINYTGNGTGRGAYIQLEKGCRVWSLPEKLRVRINPGNATVKKVSSTLTDAYGKVYSAWAFTTDELPKNTVSTLELKLSDNLDLTDIGVYPLTVNTLRLDMGASAKGQAFEILVPGFEAVYSAGGGSVAGIEAAQGVRVYPNPVKAGEAVTVEADGEANVQIFTLGGAVAAQAEINGTAAVSTEGLQAGMYLVRVTTTNGVSTAKLIVK